MDQKAGQVGSGIPWFSGSDTGSKAKAILDGRPNASCEDVKNMAKSALRHRILPSFFAESEGLNSDDIIGHLLENVAP